ncbi:hypothetical protein ACFWYW_47085 [Nonomuraea sp. NPDC059023]|uniref:hypothetical protein n=1 Tax=unclassified Nonomuraea TaxID=2593643 RepID=UPI003680D80C
MVLAADVPINPPAGVTDVSDWSLACAAGGHTECKGFRLNPALRAPAEEVTRPCVCTICNHKPKARGRPRKSA